MVSKSIRDAKSEERRAGNEELEGERIQTKQRKEKSGKHALSSTRTPRTRDQLPVRQRPPEPLAQRKRERVEARARTGDERVERARGEEHVALLLEPSLSLSPLPSLPSPPLSPHGDTEELDVRVRLA